MLPEQVRQVLEMLNVVEQEGQLSGALERVREGKTPLAVLVIERVGSEGYGVVANSLIVTNGGFGKDPEGI